MFVILRKFDFLFFSKSAQEKFWYCFLVIGALHYVCQKQKNVKIGFWTGGSQYLFLVA